MKNGKKYQWQVSTDGETWTDIAKATRNKLTVKKVTMADSGKQYRCLVQTKTGETLISEGNTLLVYLVKPIVVKEPQESSVRNGKNASFFVKAKETKRYQWQVSTDGGGTWTDILKATSSRLTVRKVTMNENGNLYRCRLTNADGESYTQAASLEVYLVFPFVTAEPKDMTVKERKNATFSLKAKEAKKYQWQVNDGGGWADIPKATSSKLTVKKVTAADSGKRYRCRLTNADGESFSRVVTLTVTP